MVRGARVVIIIIIIIKIRTAQIPCKHDQIRFTCMCISSRIVLIRLYFSSSLLSTKVHKGVHTNGFENLHGAILRVGINASSLDGDVEIITIDETGIQCQ